MICDKCSSKPATVHLKKIINGHKQEVNLCADCAKESEEFSFGMDFNLNLHEFLSGMMNVESDRSYKCPQCGIDYRHFTNEGRLGCAKCYEIFDQKLESIVKRIHGNSQHLGKIPKRAGGKIRVLKNIQSLREEIKQAVQVENFEKAAEVRDKIKALEKNLKEEDG